MHAEAPSVAPLNDLPVDAWALVTGGSFAIVAGLLVDLLRLAVHQVRHAMAGRAAKVRVWQRPGTCSACSH